MSDTPNEVTQPEAETILDMMGRPIRRINPLRMLKSGDYLLNKHGQALWEVLAFHQKGVRVGKWPEGTVSDWTWEQVYSFYERVPEAKPE